MFQFRSNGVRHFVRLTTLLLFGLIATTFAQGPRGGIDGTVKDTSGAVVVGAKVQIINQETGILERTLTSGKDGRFAAALLPVGAYRIEVTAPNFAKTVVTNVGVRITETTAVIVELKPGAVTTEVTVQAVATLVNTEAATTGQPISHETLTGLPLAAPNYLFLLGLSPGVGGEPADVRAAGRTNVDYSVNGQRTTNNSVSIEGININDFNLAHFDYLPLPNTEAIQEFKMATSLYDASLGSKGGGNVNLVLRSGTEKLHGNVYYNLRNTDFNANEWFRNNKPSTRGVNAVFNQSILGGSVGGPIPFVKGYGFFNIEGIRGRNGVDPTGSTSAPVVPNFAQNLNGTTTAALLAAQFNLSAAHIDPVAVNILNQNLSYYGGTYFIPRVGQSGCDSTATAGTPASGVPGTFGCQFNKVAANDDTQYTMTYDRPLRGGKDKFLARWFYEDGPEAAFGLGTAGSLKAPFAVTIRDRFASVSYITQISPRQVNEARMGYTRFLFKNDPTDLVSAAQVGSTAPGSFPGLWFGSITGLGLSWGTGVNDDRGTVSNQFVWGDTWTLVKGKHTIRAGGEFVRHQLNRFNNFAVRGSLGFGSAPVPLNDTVDCSGQPDPTTGINTCTNWQDFLLGRFTTTQSGAGNPLRYFRASDAALFLQDDYHLSSRVTVNLGLRWEPMEFSHDLLYRNPEFDPTTLQNTATTRATIFPQGLNIAGIHGDLGVSSCALAHCWDLNNFAPRVGFAWDVMGNQKTVLRGGYGVYFQRLSNQNILQGALGAPFFIQIITTHLNPPLDQLNRPLGVQPPSAPIIPSRVPQRSFFAGIVDANGFPTLNANDPGATVLWLDPTGLANAGSVAGAAAIFNGSGVGLCPTSGGVAHDCEMENASYLTTALDSHAPYVQQWNLTLQRQLRGGWALEVGYVGSHNVSGLLETDPFLAVLASPAKPVTVTDVYGNTYNINTNTAANEFLREKALGISFANGGGIISANRGQQLYHSLQVTASHRFQGGLFFQAGYTYAKNIDNSSGSVSTDELNTNAAGNQAGAGIFNDQTNPSANRALSDLDRKHRLVVSYDYLLPIPKHGIWGSQAFQGWGIAGLTTFQSGQPFSVIDGFAGLAFGGVGATGTAICSNKVTITNATATCTTGAVVDPRLATTTGSIQSRIGNYINPNFFSTAPAVANSPDGSTFWGNVPRNIFRGPFQQNFDFSLYKKFHFGERHEFQFRADAFNLGNHPIFDIPSSSDVQSLKTLGRITRTAVPARLIQFGLKYSF